jgi:Skp family chaperone for outer membrane proteins
MTSILGLVALAANLALASGAQAAGTPTPKILVIDRTMILRSSKAGQEIVRQVNAYTQQAENDLKAQGASLRSQGEALKQQLAILSADVKKRKVAEFESKQAGLQQLAQKKQSLIQGGFYKARQDVERALGPVLQGIMVERGANLLLDRQAVVMGTDSGLDVTALAVQRLDQKMPTVKVELVPPPPGMQQQGQQ